jgi:hypothetical protein
MQIDEDMARNWPGKGGNDVPGILELIRARNAIFQILPSIRQIIYDAIGFFRLLMYSSR